MTEDVWYKYSVEEAESIIRALDRCTECGNSPIPSYNTNTEAEYKFMLYCVDCNLEFYFRTFGDLVIKWNKAQRGILKWEVKDYS